jgi:probable rRNA maturation factor
VEIIVLNQQTRIEWTSALESALTIAVNEVARLHGLVASSEVSIVLVDDEQIHQLNQQYRGQDRPTDVLSFAITETSEEEPGYEQPEEAEVLLGDIVISLETALRQSQEYGHTLARELGYLAVHGMLHLLGYDHEDEAARTAMRAAEEKVLTAVGLDR